MNLSQIPSSVSQTMRRGRLSLEIQRLEMNQETSGLGTNGTLVLWALISIALWLITPEGFTQTDGPAGVFTMVVVGLIGLFIAVALSGVLGRLLRNR